MEYFQDISMLMYTLKFVLVKLSDNLISMTILSEHNVSTKNYTL